MAVPLKLTVPVEIETGPVKGFPTVTVPPTMTGNAVVDCPPAIHTTPPVALMEGTAVVPERAIVPLITVVPAPALTVPVTTTGNAVVLCPPAIQTAPPDMLIDGGAVVRSAGIAVSVPETTVVPAPADTVPVTTTGNAVVL
jgi:hypothetical protein